MALLAMCISSLIISNIGFSQLIEILYPLFGMLGIWQIGLLFLPQNKIIHFFLLLVARWVCYGLTALNEEHKSGSTRRAFF